ncbi:uncharacterized protein LOC113355956 [Papaver somniferum]|uniref:uncharacterized protein LOC113355956 n=1 Tax=Papaver somniferum TaxID=3469 RepID=UPI000E6FCE0E|nr:uncharacterized protein LOC113355956 [Papaver somniferum]
MLIVREEMKEGCCWTVRNGRKIDVWKDPWVPGLPTKRPEGRPQEAYNVKKVQDLIIQEEHRWDENKLQQLFTQTEVAKIMEIYIPEGTDTNTNDKLLWTPHPKGDFSAKSFIKYLNANTPSTSTNDEFPWKKFWEVKNIPPKIQIFMWRLLKNGLPVAHNISKHIHEISDQCKLCDREVENSEHLFLQCPTTQAILFASPLSLRVGEQPSMTIQNHVTQWLDEGGDYTKLKMGACVWWAVWKARNVVIFNRAKLNIQSVLKEALYWANMETTAEDMNNMLTETDIMESQKNNWEPPEVEKIKINFDGAAGPRGFACGAVARDSKSSFQGCKNQSLNYCKAVEAEGKRALLAVDLARRKGFRDIILERDSITVINALKYAHYKPNWRIQSTIDRIRDELSLFRSVDFRYVKKTANNVAHNVAALAVTSHSSNEWFTLPPSCIAQLIVSECSSV